MPYWRIISFCHLIVLIISYISIKLSQILMFELIILKFNNNISM